MRALLLTLAFFFAACLGAQAAPTLVQQASALTVTSATASVTMGSAPTNGDMLIAFCANGTSANQANTGWTFIADNSEPSQDTSWMYKVAVAETTVESPCKVSTTATFSASVWDLSGTFNAGSPADGQAGTESVAAAPPTATVTASAGTNNDLAFYGGVINGTASSGGTVSGGITLDAAFPLITVGSVYGHSLSVTSGSHAFTGTQGAGTSSHVMDAATLYVAWNQSGGGGSTGGTVGNGPWPSVFGNMGPASGVAPTPGPLYSVAGCAVYGGNDPVVNYNVSNMPIDANSATVIAANSAKAGNLGSYGDTSSILLFNLATNATPMFTVGTNGGHNPPIQAGVAGGGTNAQVPWSDTLFKLEGTTVQGCSGECHWVTLNTQTCLSYQGGGGNWTSPTGPFVSFNGLIDSMNLSYLSQTSNKAVGNATVAGIPFIGFADPGNDFLLASINHPTSFAIPVDMSLPTQTTNYAAVGGNDAGTCGSGTNITICFMMGDIIRLHASFSSGSCSSVPAYVAQLKNYGAVMTDTTGGGTGEAVAFRNALNYLTGLNTTPAGVQTCLTAMHLSDFDLVQRQTPFIGNIATPPEVLQPVYGYVTQTTGNSACAGVDPGTNGRYIYRYEESCQPGDVGGTLASECPGYTDQNLSKCAYAFYTDIGKNGCNTQTAPLWTYGNSTREAAFLHQYGAGTGTITSGNRLTVAQGSSCAGVGGSNATTYLMNVGDATFETFLASNFWTAAPWNVAHTGVFFDDWPLGYTQFSQAASAEYGNLHTFELGNGTNASAINWEQAAAAAVNTAGAAGIHMILNGIIGGYANPCSPNGVISGTGPWICVGQITPFSAFSSGEKNNQTDLVSFAAALNSNAKLDALVSENTFDINGTFQASYLTTGYINTEVTMVNDHRGDNLANTRTVDLEDPRCASCGYVRGFMDALQGLVGGPDNTPFDIQWRSPNKGNATSGWLEPNFWPDEALIVPYKPYITPADYVYNGSSGTVKENGTGCPSFGDTGGAVALLLACSGTDGVYSNCWQLAFNNGTNLGPTCFFLNTTGSAHTITTADINSICNCASAFVGGSVVTYTGFEMLTVPDYLAPGGTVSTGCTGAGLANCNGAMQLTGTNFVAGTTTVPGPGGIEILGPQ